MKQNLVASFVLALSPLGLALACGTSAPDGPGGTDSLAGGSGSTGATMGGAASGESSAAGSSVTGGDPSPGGTGGGGSASASGGAGGGEPGAGSGGAGGDGGGGAGGAVDSEGCPLTLEGFASVSGEGQDGTYGGRDGETVTVTTQADLEKYAGAAEPYVIRVQGKITMSPKGKEISVASDKTIVGVGATAEISQGGFFLGSGVHNVILRNLTIGDTFVEGDWEGKTQDFDGVQMDTAHHVWIDHCHLHHIGDGMIDSRKDTSYLTVSWSILSDHNKAFGIGWTENLTAQMTIHHNWFRDLNQRNPSTDNVLRAHLYNNWLQRIDSYGNYARGGTNMVLENSVFDTVNRPHYYDDGTLVATGNIYRSTSGDKESSGSTYSFFDPSDFYEYSLDPADQVEALLTRCAGPRPGLGL
ncbi:pectate lyase family protein [Sorangium sp. So ce394]|uniref:pectate lyase family protein n=1 Tax=Sorangium sp. So ce394 TaxID=3133310 RepID=UPI003F5BD0CA